MRFSPQALHTRQSGIRDIVALAVESTKDVLRLELGESTIASPPHVVAAAHDAALAGHTRYTASTGILPLRTALCKKLRIVNGIDVMPENLMVTTGAIEGLFLLISSLASLGDEILIPDPAWPNYRMIAEMIGVRPIGYPCRPESGGVPSVAEIEAQISDRTRVLVVNSPSNPTGAVFPPNVIDELVALADRRGLVLISDETYDELYFAEPPVCALRKVGPEAHVVSVFSFSKTYAMTGWRVGYVVGSRDLIGMLAKLHEAVNSSVTTVSQHAAIAALEGPPTWVSEQREALGRVRDEAVGVLTDLGCEFIVPDGSFYLWVSVGAWDSAAFAHRLFEAEGIAVAPGSAFGELGQGHIRICLAALGDQVDDALNRIVRLVLAGPVARDAAL